MFICLCVIPPILQVSLMLVQKHLRLLFHFWTRTTRGIQADEAKSLASPKYVYLLQLFAISSQWLQNLYSSLYHHRIIICVVCNNAQKTTSTLLGQSLETPLTDSLFNLLYIEANQNVYAELKLNGSNDSVILNAKVGSRNVTLWKIKESLEKSKPEIFQSMVGNISQIEDGTFAGLMSAFDLVSNDKFDSRATKISIMHVVCGLNKNQIQLYDVILMSK